MIKEVTIMEPLGVDNSLLCLSSRLCPPDPADEDVFYVHQQDPPKQLFLNDIVCM